MSSPGELLLYFAPLALIFLLFLKRSVRREEQAREALGESEQSGLTVPPTLHPLIDPLRCLGCASCVHACPESASHPVLGLIDRKAVLVSPTNCVGHGACAAACPTQAIRLVFGTAERGVDIPVVRADYSTTVPGVFIAGELGGMGLIRNAVRQGVQAVDGIRRYIKSVSNQQREFDVVIVGAGPAGLAATLAAKEAALSYRTIEQGELGGAIASFPRGKVVMTEPANLPLAGPFRFSSVAKEELLAFWREIPERTGIVIHSGERLINAKRTAAGLIDVETTSGHVRSAALLLAIGRRGTPRRLGVTGEDLPKVAYELRDADDYRNLDVVVVGAGDSALEAACALADSSCASVTLICRGADLSKARKLNQQNVLSQMACNRLSVHFNTEVTAIGERSIRIRSGASENELQNDSVIIAAGGVLPSEILQQIGISIETRFGT